LNLIPNGNIRKLFFILDCKRRGHKATINRH